MLYAQRFSRFIAIVAVCATVGVGLPARCAETTPRSQTALVAGQVDGAATKPVLIAQANCVSCGATLNPIALMASSSKKRSTSPLTDSLWGNLILELAYQRDPQLRSLAAKTKVSNICTKAAIGTIALGTLAQGVVSVATLNPTPPHLDSYSPLIIGTALSSVTIMLMVAKTTSNFVLMKQITNRQVALKNHVEMILAHMESCSGNCPDAKKELTGLIGDHAAREWVELFRSSHQLAMTSQSNKVSMLDAARAAQ